MVSEVAAALRGTDWCAHAPDRDGRIRALAQKLSDDGATATDVHALWRWATTHGWNPPGLFHHVTSSPYRWKSVLADLRLHSRERALIRRHRWAASEPEWARKRSEPVAVSYILDRLPG